MAKNLHNRTNLFAKHYTIFVGEEILEFFVVPMVKTHLSRGFEPFNLGRKLCLIEKFWKLI